MSRTVSSAGVDFDYKIIVLGESGVGKTNLLTRYADGSFDPNSRQTIGVELQRLEVEMDGQTIRLNLWDTAGQERFRSLNKVYFRGAHGVIIVYDITNAASFRQINEWYQTAKENGCEPPNTCFMLIGNKCDMTSEREVSTTDGIAIAVNFQMIFFESSAKDATNVDKAFEQLRRQTTTIYTDMKETNTVLELKKTIQGILKRQAEEISIWNPQLQTELDDGTTLKDCGFDAKNAPPQTPMELHFKFVEDEVEEPNKFPKPANYSVPPELPDVMRPPNDAPGAGLGAGNPQPMEAQQSVG